MNPLGVLFHKVKKKYSVLSYYYYFFFFETMIIIIVIIIYTVPQSCWWMHMKIPFSPISNYGQYSGLEHVLNDVLGNVWNHYTWIWTKVAAINSLKSSWNWKDNGVVILGYTLWWRDRNFSKVVCCRSWDADTCSRETLLPQRCREHRRTRGMYPLLPPSHHFASFLLSLTAWLSHI